MFINYTINCNAKETKIKNRKKKKVKKIKKYDIRETITINSRNKEQQQQCHTLIIAGPELWCHRLQFIHSFIHSHRYMFYSAT
jgi:viroplasmin and RNaseH domain-containing protein